MLLCPTQCDNGNGYRDQAHFACEQDTTQRKNQIVGTYVGILGLLFTGKQGTSARNLIGTRFNMGRIQGSTFDTLGLKWGRR